MVFMKISTKQDLASLNPVERASLNATLSKRERFKTYHYYLQISLADDQGEERKKLCGEIARQLPALPIIYMGFEGDGVAIFASPEVGLMGSAREFLQIPHQA